MDSHFVILPTSDYLHAGSLAVGKVKSKDGQAHAIAVVA